MGGEPLGMGRGIQAGAAVNISFVKWVTVARAAELTGYSVASIQHKIQSGLWSEGTEWKWADNHPQTPGLVARPTGLEFADPRIYGGSLEFGQA